MDSLVRTPSTSRTPPKSYSKLAPHRRSERSKKVTEEAGDHPMGEPDEDQMETELHITVAMTRKAIKLFTAGRMPETCGIGGRLEQVNSTIIEIETEKPMDNLREVAGPPSTDRPSVFMERGN